MTAKRGYICSHCSKFVKYTAPGTKNRNHCPYCLYSLHVDVVPGDRSAACKGDMAPIGKMYKPDGEELVVHRCEKCGFTRKNRVAGDDSYARMEKLPIVGEEVLTK